MEFLDLNEAGLSEWQSPQSAAGADAASLLRLQQMLVATRLLLQQMHWKAETRLAEKKLERELDDLRYTGMMIASCLNAERSTR